MNLTLGLLAILVAMLVGIALFLQSGDEGNSETAENRNEAAAAVSDARVVELEGDAQSNALGNGSILAPPQLAERTPGESRTELRVNLKEGAFLRVVHDATGEPLVGLELRLLLPEASPTDADGTTVAFLLDDDFF
ncbi:MAG: hypothetical protein ACI8QS_002414 [Planctomycetota bacterium]|jgi:hypothetical protein